MSTYSATCQTTTMTCSLTSPPKRRVMFRRMNSSPCLGTNDLNDSQEETNTSLENNEKDGQHSKITSSPRPIMKNSLSGSALQDNADEDDLSNKPSPRNKKILKRKVKFPIKKPICLIDLKQSGRDLEYTLETFLFLQRQIKNP